MIIEVEKLIKEYDSYRKQKLRKEKLNNLESL